MAGLRRTQGTNVVIFAGIEATENDENAGVRRGKTGLLSARAPLQDRTVTSQNVMKVQAPPAKQAFKSVCIGQENISLGQASKPYPQQDAFAIFKDEDQAAVSNEASSAQESFEDHEMELHPAVTDIFKPTVAKSSSVFDYPAEETESNITVESAMMSVCSPEEEMCEDDSFEDAETKPIENVVRDEKPLWFPEYQRDIYKYLREAEARHGIRADYMRKQTDITHSMRSILIDWMVEVAEEYKLDRETLSLSACYVDRFLSVMAVVRAKLQLVGATAMFIASKYEEIYPPEVGEFVYITDNTYTKKQVLQMERLMLRTLGFNVASPTVNCFCSNLLTSLGADDRTRSLAMMPTVSELTGYSKEELSSCINDVVTIHSTAATLPHPAIREKYAKAQWHHVSEIAPVSVVPNEY